ncbi:MAG: hypothetical protein KHW83_04985 [Streptococcus sp.]|nr:hypothetical protein [Streptococcus sp.]
MVCVAVPETLPWMSFVKVSNTLTLVALTCTLLLTWLPMKEMKKVLTEIQDGTFASKWINENKVGRSHFHSCRRIESEHQLEAVGKELRKMYSWNEE